MMKKIVGIFTALTLGALLWAQAPVRLVDRFSSGIVLGAPGSPFNTTLTTISTGGTTLTTATVKVKLIHCRNNTASSATIQISDTGGNVYFPTNSLAANSVMTVIYGDIGLTMNGLLFTAGTSSAIACQVEGAF